MKTTLLLITAAALVLALPVTATADTFEPNDTAATAYGPMGSGTPYVSFIGQDGDEDYFYFEAGLGPVSVTLTDIPVGNDYDIYFADSDGNIIDNPDLWSENEGNLDELIEGISVTVPGRFWLLVVGFLGDFSDSEPYTLTANFTPLNPTNTDPSVAVTYPNGGETLTAGSSVNILWSASDVEDGAALSIDIDYSANNGGSWTSVATGLDNDGSHPWTVPAQVTAQGLVRVTATDSGPASTSDVSNAVFTVQSGIIPDLALTLPAGLIAGPGATFDVPVSFAANLPVAALQFALTYSPDILTPVSVNAGPRVAGLTMESSSTTAGEVRMVIYSTQGTAMAAGSGVACTVRFQVAASPPGNASLGFADVVAGDALGNALPVSAVGTDVVPVRGVTLSATAAAEGVVLQWTAEARGTHAGFRVLREELGEARPLHTGLLAADARAYTDHRAVPDRAHVYWLEAVDRDGSTQRFGPVDVFVTAGPLWAGIPYPNPSRETVHLDLRAAPGEAVIAVVVDLNGRVVRELDVPAAGALRWDGRVNGGVRAPAGVYFLHVRQGARAITRRVVRLTGR